MSYQGESSQARNPWKRSRPLKVNLEYCNRLKNFTKRLLWLEKGINVDAMEGTGIPKVVKGRQWERYMQHPNDASEKLVREFYASMISNDFFVWGTVLVQG
ncbi:hypothetical protein ACOSP7_015075 [Xanthoceras sorbifolium]